MTQESNIPRIIDSVFDCLLLLSKDDNNDERFFIAYDLYDIDEIMLNFHSFIGSKLVHPDAMINHKNDCKFLMIMKDVYYTIYIDNLYNCDINKCSAEFLFKRFALLDEAEIYFNSL